VQLGLSKFAPVDHNIARGTEPQLHPPVLDPGDDDFHVVPDPDGFPKLS
jgi:hypothetical protein